MDCTTPDSSVLCSFRVCSKSCALNLWCYLTISSSAVPFSSCLQSLPVSGSFPKSWLLTQGGQSIATSASASVLPMNIQGWFPLGLTDLISMQTPWESPRDSQESSQTPQLENINSSALSLLYGPALTSIHDYWKNLGLTAQTFVYIVMSLLFNMLSGFVTAFFPRSKHLLISWLQSPPKKIKSVTASTCSPSICQEVMGPDSMTLVFGFF